jgi:hypothetical protein
VILEKLQKEDSGKHVGFDIVAGRNSSSQGHRNLNSDFFLSSKSKTNDPPSMPDLSLIENLCGIFKAKLDMSEPYSKNIEYLQATAEACREMISP